MNKSIVICMFLIFLVTFITFASDESDKSSSNITNNSSLTADDNNSLKEIKSNINFDKDEKKYIRKYLYPEDINIFNTNEMENIYAKYKYRAAGLLASGLISSGIGQLAFIGYMFTEYIFPSYSLLMYLSPQVIPSLFSNPIIALAVVGKIMLALTTFTLLTIPFVLIPLAAIAFWHAGKIKKLAKKVNGELGLSELDKTSLFMINTNINNTNCKIDLDVTFRI